MACVGWAFPHELLHWEDFVFSDPAPVFCGSAVLQQVQAFPQQQQWLEAADGAFQPWPFTV